MTTRGFAFAVSPRSDGGLAWVEGPESVAQGILAILLTEPGERIGHPDYGAGLRQFLFAPNTVQIRTAMADVIRDALQRHEPRAVLGDVSVYADESQPTVAHIRIRYRTTDAPGAELVTRFSFDDGVLP
ncbi:MAG: GPW/gp25 family protein [Alphaproteobacteria bacterium]|nr:GPW/gp25 family protein [Alphaproteobacteria bacterium]